MKKWINLIIISLFLIPQLVYSVPTNTIAVPNTFTANTVIYSSQVNANFNEIQNKFNLHSHTDITQLGTITTGVWQGTKIEETYLNLSAGLKLPSGAVFFMLTGSCPSGSTDVTATYADKFIRINATQGTTGGSDTVTLAEANLPSHTHGVGTLTVGDEQAHQHYENAGGAQAYTGSASANKITTSVAGDSSKEVYKERTSAPISAHTHTLSGSTGATGSGTAVTITNPYVTCKMCQVN